MDAKALKEITSELSLLYVEDDEPLRGETAKLFSHLFQDVDLAENGKVALDMYKDKDYDLVVTDIDMPIMDGLKLCQEIRTINPLQSIIVTSAHDDSSYLLELIDIGIDKFILKPLDMQKFLFTLSFVCGNIKNEKLIRSYKKEIETSNKNLKQANEELESIVKILDTKIIQMNSTNKVIKKIPQQSPRDAINFISSKPPQTQKKLLHNTKDLYVYNDYFTSNDLKELKKFEGDIDSIITLFNLQTDISKDSVVHFSKSIASYSKLLKAYPLFKNLSEELNLLSQSITLHLDFFTQACGEICILLESFIYVLKKCNLALFSKGIKDPNIYDISMINDIRTIILILDGNSNEIQEKQDFFT
ncbi:response regulator [Sulfurimonas sp. MAG313]|nr:response regulator [Sulfurimonas sp. MAG313]MDF1879997.1 response regulator [Sulfurimonas sp. MAG313]